MSKKTEHANDDAVGTVKAPSIRLNAADRARIVANATARFDRERAEIIARRLRLAHKIYKAQVPSEVLRHLKALPEIWTTRGYDFFVNLGGQSIRFYSDGADSRNYQKTYQSIWYLPRGHDNLGIVTDQALIDEHRQITGELEDLASRVTTVTAQVDALVRSCTTLSQLNAVWPEGAPFWADIDFTNRGGPKRQLPSVAISSLNEALGLKTAA